MILSMSICRIATIYSRKKNKKSIVRINGGLGNQLFQICFGLSLSYEQNNEVLLDLIEYRYHKGRNSRKFHKITIPTLRTIHSSNVLAVYLPKRLSNILGRIERKSVRNKVKYGLRVQRESPIIFDKKIEKTSKSYFVGNFVSHKYWEGDPRTYIELMAQSLKLETLYTSPRDEKSIGMHVRRGDYVSDKKTREFHGFCTDEYFLTGITLILNNDPSIKTVVIATDSYELVTNLVGRISKLGLNPILLQKQNELETLAALSSAEYFIGSNSTFSWWAAAFSKAKCIYFPHQWFASDYAGFDSADYFPFRINCLDIPLATTWNS